MSDNFPSGYTEPPSFEEYVAAKDDRINELVRQIAHVRAETIKECAKIADIWAKTEPTSGALAPLIATVTSTTGSRIAEQIRALNKEGRTS